MICGIIITYKLIIIMNNKKIFVSLILAVLILIAGLIFYQKVTKKTVEVLPIPKEVTDSFNNGDLNKAIDLSTESVKSNSENISALIALSLSWAQKGSLEFNEKEYGQKALDYANQALDLDPNNVEANIALGYAKEIMGNYVGANEAYSKAISLDPNSVDAYLHRGHAYDLSGNLNKAEIDYVKASSIDSSNLDVAMNLGRLFLRQGRLKDAEAKFIKVSTFADNIRLKSEAFYDLSFIALNSTSTKAIDEAFKYASSSVSTDPTYPQAYVALGNVYKIKGDSKTALELLNKALSMYPNLSYAIGLIADIYSKEKKVDMAITTYEQQKRAIAVDVGLMNNDRASMIVKADFNEAFTYAENYKKAESVDKLKEIIANNKDPLIDINILFVLSDKTKYNRLNSLFTYKPYTDLVKQFQDKIKSGFQANKEKTTKQSLMQKFISFFVPEKANAWANVNGICGRTNDGGFVYLNIVDYVQDDIYNMVCGILAAYINGDEEFDYAQSFADINTAILNAHWWVGGTYSFTQDSSFVGCANGVGALYQAAPPVPTDATATCSGESKKVTLNWTNPSGYDTVYLRMVDKTVNPDYNPDTASGISVVWNDNYTSNSFSTDIISGHTYAWWIQTKNTTSGFWSPSVGGEFNCETQYAEDDFSLSCKANPVATSSEIEYKVTPNNASGTVSYVWSPASLGTVSAVSGGEIFTTPGYENNGIYTNVSVTGTDSLNGKKATASCLVVVGCTSTKPEGLCKDKVRPVFTCVGNKWEKTGEVPCGSTDLGDDLNVIPNPEITEFKFKPNIVDFGKQCPLYFTAFNVSSCYLENKLGQISIDSNKLTTVRNAIKIVGDLKVSVGTHTLKCKSLKKDADYMSMGTKSCYASPDYIER
jgi:tetratricopeptide (TPR) repeat protein